VLVAGVAQKEGYEADGPGEFDRHIPTHQVDGERVERAIQVPKPEYGKDDRRDAHKSYFVHNGVIVPSKT